MVVVAPLAVVDPLDLPSVEDPLDRPPSCREEEAVGLPEEGPEEAPSVVAGTWPVT